MPIVIVENSTDTILGIPASQMQGPGIYTITNGAVSAFSPLPVPGTTQPGTVTPVYTSVGIYVNVQTYGADPTGVSDSTAAIATARSLVNAAGGGTVYYPPGTYITGNQPLYSKVHDKGAGWEATILKLKNGANADLFSYNTAGIALNAAFGGGSNNGVAWWSISDMTLDGNRANQSSGPSWLLRFVGYGYYLQNLHIRNGFTGGVQFDWNPASPPTHYNDTRMNNVVITDCNGIGLEHNSGDGAWVNVLVGVTGSHCAHFCPNGGATNMTNCHFWGPATGTNSVCLLDESSFGVYTNCQFESSDTAQVVLLSTNVTLVGGRIFSGGVGTPMGIQLGQAAGNTPYSGQNYQTVPLATSGGTTTAKLAFYNYIETAIDDCTNATNGAIWFANEQQDRIRTRVSQTAGIALAGTIANSSDVDIRVFGLTPDGTAAKGGIFKSATHTNAGFTVTDDAGNEFLRVDTKNQFMAVPNNQAIAQYIDFYSTVGSALQAGTVLLRQSATTPDPGAGGTVTTTNVGISKVTPAASRAGCILQAGTRGGQVCWVENESASFTISWAAQATSNIAGEAGGTFVLATNGAQLFIWNSARSLWQKAS